jgi:flagellar basal body-associated protein FliL
MIDIFSIIIWVIIISFYLSILGILFYTGLEDKKEKKSWKEYNTSKF